ncbi:putative xylan 1,4-beta-Xylosidase [Thozetella sp. PMI_491]|nr:putative xylan 1,4-beta-Xylosidase [Thozetella sp. PMI_491]
MTWKVLLILAAVPAALADFPDCKKGPLAGTTVCDVNADPAHRAAALVKLLTTKEKIRNSGNFNPALPRLGLPSYDWLAEALHGLAVCPGVNFSDEGQFSYSTSFPMPINLGATFDDVLVHDVATVISTEARAFNNGNRTGLDFWSPNINPFKDPRWGRGPEVPGEDTYHISSYTAALIEGLQGKRTDKYKRIAATCKHFAGYDLEDWHGNYRFQFDAKISVQDLAEYYTLPFRSCVRDSNVAGVMCTYNAVNGVPTCADPYLLQTILREHWGWTNEEQWVVADCDSVQNIYYPHEYSNTREEAVAAALNAGTDIDCGEYYPDYLGGALAQRLINESTLDRALIRRYSTLVRVGWFDPPELNPYRAIGWSDVDTPYARQLAHKAAVESIVLLKNDGVLPLRKKKVKSIAILGDWANATQQMQGAYFGPAPYLKSPLWAAQQLGLEVNYGVGAYSPINWLTDHWLESKAAAEKSDVIVFIGGIDETIEWEGRDRTRINWAGHQLDMIEKLAALGKPMIVYQMGGGQIDSSPIVKNKNIEALLWGGYPGQEGGPALMDVLFGNAAPAARLPVTQYPSNYITQIPMTEMSLRPSANSPGRTYRWYEGNPVFEFGTGKHYTTFTAHVNSPQDGQTPWEIKDLLDGCDKDLYKFPDLCPFTSFHVEVKNTGTVTSDYVTLGFVAGEFGPEPRPKKTLVSYQRLHDIKPGKTATAQLNLTLASISRVDIHGNTAIYPGEYSLLVDLEPLTQISFSIKGEPVVLDEWPQIPTRPTKEKSGYFVNDYLGEKAFAAITQEGLQYNFGEVF